MAEARQGVAFQFAVTSEGVRVEFDRKVLRAALLALLGAGKKRYLSIRNAVLRGIFPASPISLAVITGGVLGSHYLLQHDTTFGISGVIVDILGKLGVEGGWVPHVLMACEAFGAWVIFSYLQRFLLRRFLSYHGWMFDRYGHRSVSTRVWRVGVRVFALFTRPQLYSYQSSLPRLPVPALKDTCRRYLESVKPLLGEEEYQEIEQLVRDFQAGPGQKMQRYLVLKSWWSSNYVTDWWELYVYLHGRSSIMINSNYYACGMVGTPIAKDPAVRLAHVSYTMMRLKRDIYYQRIKPLMVMGFVPLCSSQHERTFGTVRQPGQTHDQLLHFPGAESDHCVVHHTGRWYKVPLTASSGRLFTSAELECIFRALWKDVDREVQEGVAVREGEEHLAALTTLDRTEWAVIYDEHFKAGVNKVSMETIEKAAFVVFFSPKEPITAAKGSDNSDMTAYCKDLLHGNGHSLWFDKSITLVIYKNGKLGVNAEHSWADAPIIGYMMEYCSNMELEIGYDNGHCWNYDKAVAPVCPQRLDWDLQACVTEINSAQKFAEEQIADLDLYVMRHDAFGKGVIKTCGISPDAFIQMALQMAYYKDAGKLCLTYEASMTRLYLEGRTETVRPVTEDSAHFVRAMCDQTVTNEEKKALLRVATDRHAASYKKAMTGHGIDRHLFCLYVVSKYLKLDSPFLSKVLKEPWRLSTSQTPAQQTGKMDYNKHPERISGGGGFGSVAKDGYGVSYIIQGDHVIFFHVSAYNSSDQTNAHRFAELIKESLREMKDLF